MKVLEGVQRVGMVRSSIGAYMNAGRTRCLVWASLQRSNLALGAADANARRRGSDGAQGPVVHPTHRLADSRTLHSHPHARHLTPTVRPSDRPTAGGASRGAGADRGVHRAPRGRRADRNDGARRRGIRVASVAGADVDLRVGAVVGSSRRVSDVCDRVEYQGASGPGRSREWARGRAAGGGRRGHFGAGLLAGGASSRGREGIL